MITEQIELAAAGNRRLVAWRSRDEEAAHGPVAVIGPGIGQRMRHSGAIAQYLTGNGATVLRYDALDNPGLSDGEVTSFSLSSAWESLRAVVGHARRSGPGGGVAVLAISAAAVPAYHLAAEGGVDRLVCMSGVVDFRSSIGRYLGVDYFDQPVADLPARIAFEGHEVDPSVMWHDSRQRPWYGLEPTRAALARVTVPVMSVIGLADEWVSAEEVGQALGGEARGERAVIQLPHATHSVLRNPAAMRAILGTLTRLVLGLPEVAPIVEPTFEQLLDTRARERSREFAQLGKGSRVPEAAAGERG